MSVYIISGDSGDLHRLRASYLSPSTGAILQKTYHRSSSQEAMMGALEFPSEIETAITVCALRFDGYSYATQHPFDGTRIDGVYVQT